MSVRYVAQSTRLVTASHMDTPVDYNHRDKTLRHVTASPLAPHGRRQRLRFALYFVGCTHAHCPARRAAPLKHSKAPTPRSSGHSLAHLSGQLCASHGAPAVSTSPPPPRSVHVQISAQLAKSHHGTAQTFCHAAQACHQACS